MCHITAFHYITLNKHNIKDIIYIIYIEHFYNYNLMIVSIFSNQNNLIPNDGD